MPQWDKIHRPLYGLVGLGLIVWQAGWGRVEMAWPVLGAGIALCGITGGLVFDAIRNKPGGGGGE